MSRASLAVLAAVALGLAACAGEGPEQESALLNTEPLQPDVATPATSAAPAPAPRPAPEPPQPRIAIVKQGTILQVSMASSLSSATANAGDRFEAEVTRPVTVDGEMAIPAGSRVRGFVEDVHKAKRGAGHGSLTLRFDRLVLPDGQEAELQAGLAQETDGKKKRNAAIIGGSAAGGAVLGRVLGDDTKDAAIGAVVGGAIATGVVMAKKGDQVELPAGTVLDLHLEEPAAVPLPQNLS